MMRNILVLLAFLIGNAQAQENTKDPIIFLAPHYNFHIPSWDLAKQYGMFSSIGLEVLRINSSNLVYGIGVDFIAGGTIKDTNLLSHLEDERGYIITEDGEVAEILLYQRGYNLQLKGGYFKPLSSPSSGLLALGGIGFTQYKTKIDVRDDNVPALNIEHIKMYDHLTNGLSSSGFLGYLHISEKNRFHFYAGIELHRAFTYNRRSYNYSSNGAEKQLRNDFSTSLKIGWIIPISKRSTTQYYYY